MGFVDGFGNLFFLVMVWVMWLKLCYILLRECCLREGTRGNGI